MRRRRVVRIGGCSGQDFDFWALVGWTMTTGRNHPEKVVALAGLTVHDVSTGSNFFPFGRLAGAHRRIKSPETGRQRLVSKVIWGALSGAIRRFQGRVGD